VPRIDTDRIVQTLRLWWIVRGTDRGQSRSVPGLLEKIVADTAVHEVHDASEIADEAFGVLHCLSDVRIVSPCPISVLEDEILRDEPDADELSYG